MPVSEVAGTEIYQRLHRLLGQSGLPRLRRGGRHREGPHRPRSGVLRHQPLDRVVLETLIRDGQLSDLIHAGVSGPSGRLQRLHRHVGQAPASGRNSCGRCAQLSGRSGTRGGQRVPVLPGDGRGPPALTGIITDPRTHRHALPADRAARVGAGQLHTMLVAPLARGGGRGGAAGEIRKHHDAVPDLGKLGPESACR